MPLFAAILVGLVLGGVTAHYVSGKKVSMLPSWVTAGDAIPNRLTKALADAGGGGGGGNAPSPIEDIAKTVQKASLAVSAAGLSSGGQAIFGGNPTAVTQLPGTSGGAAVFANSGATGSTTTFAPVSGGTGFAGVTPAAPGGSGNFTV